MNEFKTQNYILLVWHLNLLQWTIYNLNTVEVISIRQRRVICSKIWGIWEKILDIKFYPKCALVLCLFAFLKECLCSVFNHCSLYEHTLLESSWSWSYGSRTYNYLCNQCLSPLKWWVRTSFIERCTRCHIMW